MARWLVRFSAAILAVAACLFAFNSAQLHQENAPFGTSVSFQLDVSSAKASKEELAQGLTVIADDLDILICKVSPAKDDYRHERDIVLFCSRLPASDGPAVRGDEVHWLDPDMHGKLIRSDALQDRTMNGVYRASYSPELENRLASWGEANGVRILYRPDALGGTFAGPLSTLLLSGGGLILIAAVSMHAASLACLAQTRIRSVGIRAIGGVSVLRLRIEDALDSLLLSSEGLMVGGVLFALVIAVRPIGFTQLQVVVREANPAIWAVPITSCSLLAALFTLPISLGRLGHDRRLRPRGLAVLCTLFTLIGMAFSTISASGAFALLDIQKDISDQQSIITLMPDVVRVSLPAMPEGDGAKERERDIRKLVLRGEEEGAVLLSLDVGQEVSLTQDDLGPFDSFVLMNEAFASRFGIGIEREGRGGKLIQLSDDALSPSLLEQVNVWFDASGSGETPPLGFYRYVGAGIPVLGPNVGSGGACVSASDPIVLMIDDLSSGWNVDGFVYPLLSTGNIFFSDYGTLLSLISETGVQDEIVAIDSISELSLGELQQVHVLMARYLFAVLVSLAALVIMSACDAVSWAQRSSRRIFARISSGHAPFAVALDAFGGVVARGAIAGSVGACASLAIAFRAPAIAVMSGLTSVFVYLACNVVFRRHFALRSFARTVQRR